MFVSRRQNANLIHMYIIYGGAHPNALQIVCAQNKLNPVKTYPVLAQFLGIVHLSLKTELSLCK